MYNLIYLLVESSTHYINSANRFIYNITASGDRTKSDFCLLFSDVLDGGLELVLILDLV